MIWKDIPGYGGKYQASVDGHIRRTYKTKEPRELSQFTRKGEPTLWVKICFDGDGRERKVSHLVYQAFVGDVPKGMALHHKNGDIWDNSVNNLAPIGKQKLGRLTGAKSRRVPVAKQDVDGAVVGVYRSAREAARQNHMSHQTVTDVCNGKVKRGYAPDGFVYRWET